MIRQLCSHNRGSVAPVVASVASQTANMPPLIWVVTKCGDSLEFTISESSKGKENKFPKPNDTAIFLWITVPFVSVFMIRDKLS
jgi:hypothetical protein